MNTKSASFSRLERVRRAEEYRAVLKKGIVTRSKWLALYRLPNGARMCRLGIMINSRLVRNAADRNRAKRLAREFFRLNKQKFQQNFDIVIRAVNRPNQFTGNELRETLKDLFCGAGILAD